MARPIANLFLRAARNRSFDCANISYISERGFGPWLSVATTDSASDKLLAPQLRKWRIIAADAF